MRVPLFLSAVVLLSGCGEFFQKLQGGSRGEVCLADTECGVGLVCSHEGTCLFDGEPGTAAYGEECISSAFCGIGLVCSGAGSCAVMGDPGTAQLGEACEVAEDCMGTLQCSDEGTCYGFDVPLWLGGSCENGSDDGPARAYFEVSEGEPVHDFYRQPFPTDALVYDGALDLTGHPSPGPAIPEVGDLVGEVIAALQDDFRGFGPNEAAFFRFSRELDPTTLVDGLPGDGTLAIVDITPDSPDFGAPHPMQFEYTADRGAYICANWLAVAPASGRPLHPGHTYAIVLTRGVRTLDGTEIGQDVDFAAVLSAASPGDERLQHAWEAFAPLRSWMMATGTGAATLVDATVFTVSDPVTRLAALREAVRDLPRPTVDIRLVCDGDPGPFADSSDPTRGCLGVDEDYFEIQGTVGIPHFQQGLPPFKDVSDGGGIAMVNGVPVLDHYEDVTFSLTIPKGQTMPPDGWPVVLYGHGTGGNYRSAPADGLSDRLGHIELDGETYGFAVLTIDAAMHGPRRHPENWKETWLAIDPNAYAEDVLFFNPVNPRAARDNTLQAAADWFAVAYAFETLDIAPINSPTGYRIRLDGDQLWYLGHSQGGSTGAVVAGHEPALRGSVLAAAGGLLIESLVHKTNPHDIAAATAVGLLDADVTRMHPVLNLFQALAESADGVNHAIHVHQQPLGDFPPRHVLQIYGVGDTYTPDETQYPLAGALGVHQVVGQGTTRLPGILEVDAPVSGNRRAGEITAITYTFAPPEDRDAHFVLFDRDDTRRVLQVFLASGVRDGVPTVSP